MHEFQLTRGWYRQAACVTTALLDRLTHHCHIVETGNESFRFRHSTLAAKTRIKARESACKGGLAAPALLEVDATDAVDEESEVDEPF